MPEEEQRPAVMVPVWGIVILFTGIVLLLQILGILHWEIWGTLWKFWPVIIIIYGLSFLLYRWNVWLVSLLSLAMLGGCLWIAVSQHSSTLSHDLWLGEQQYSASITGIETASAQIVFPDSGSLLIGSLEADSMNLVEVQDAHDVAYEQSSFKEPRITMLADFNQDGGVGSISLKPVNREFWEKWHIGWRVNFNRQIPLTLDMDCDAAHVALDLTELNLSKLNLEMDVCNGHLHVPDSPGTAVVNIDMDVSNLEIVVPEGVSVKIQADTNISLFVIDKNRFPRQGDYYISPDYDNAKNRVLLNILCDVGRIAVK
jgi:hypothetical protein